MPIQFNQHKTFYSSYGQNRDFWPKGEKERNPNKFYELLASPYGRGLLSGKQDLLRIIAEQAYYASGRPYYLVYPCILDLIDRIPDATPMRAITLPGVPDVTNLGGPYLGKMVETTTRPPLGLQAAAEEASSAGLVSAQCIALRFPEGCDHLSILACFVTLGSSQLVGLHCNIRDPQGRPGLLMRDSCVNITDLNNNEPDDTLGDLLKDISAQDTRRGVPPGERWYRGIRALACLGMLVESGAGFLERDLLSRDAGKPETPEAIERARKAKGLGWSLGEALERTPHMRRPHFAIRHTGPGRRVPLLRPIRGAVIKAKKLTSVPTGLEANEE